MVCEEQSKLDVVSHGAPRFLRVCMCVCVCKYVLVCVEGAGFALLFVICEEQSKLDVVSHDEPHFLCICTYRCVYVCMNI